MTTRKRRAVNPFDMHVDLPTAKLIGFLILAFTAFIAFFSIYRLSFGVEYFLLGVLLILLSIDADELLEVLPPFLMSIVTVTLLVLSGRLAERGFNAPILHAQKPIFYFYVISASLMMRKLPFKWKSRVVKTALFAVVVSCLVSIYYVVFVDAEAIRYSTTKGYGMVLTFDQSYSLPLLSVTLLGAMKMVRRRKRDTRRLIPYFLMIAVCVAISMFTTCLLLMIMGFIMVIALDFYRRHRSAFFVVSLLVLVVLLFVYLFAEPIAQWLYGLTEGINQVLRLRLRSVIDSVLGVNMNIGYTTARREELASYSLNSFAANPFFGVGYKKYGYGVIGAHQEWYDLLGTFGLTGALLFGLSLLFNLIRAYKSCRTRLDRRCFVICAILFVLLGFLNPCLNIPVLFALFIIAPNISSLFLSRRKK